MVFHRWGRPPRYGYGVVLALIVATYALALSADGRWTLTALVFVQSATVWQALRVSRTRPGVRAVAAVAKVVENWRPRAWSGSSRAAAEPVPGTSFTRDDAASGPGGDHGDESRP